MNLVQRGPRGVKRFPSPLLLPRVSSRRPGQRLADELQRDDGGKGLFFR